MPLLYSLAIHDALQRVKEGLFPGEMLFAFLDDVCVVCSPNRVRAVFDVLARELSEQAGIQLSEGKTRVWNRAGVRPPHMEDLGTEVWNDEGVKILGTPIGSDRFIEAVTEKRLTEERRLWDALAWVPDLQSAWQILLQCAGHDATISFVENLAAARARDAPPTLQRSTFLGWRRRWSRMLSISCGRSFANSLVAQSTVPHALAGIDGSVPNFADLLGEV